MSAQFLSSVTILIALLTLSGSATAFQPAFNPRLTSTSLDAISRREVLASSAAAMVVAGVPLDALADVSKIPEPTDPAKFSFNGVFKDPKHPKGYRTIAGAPNKDGTLVLQDDPKGEVYKIPIKSMKDEETGKITIAMDFSVKGGPSDVLATVNKDSSISFPDGNVWKKERGIAGVYIDGYAPYPKYRRVIRQESGKLAIDMVNGKKTFTIYAKAGSTNITVDFPGKTCTATISVKNGMVYFSDGNSWTKV